MSCVVGDDVLQFGADGGGDGVYSVVIGVVDGVTLRVVAKANQRIIGEGVMISGLRDPIVTVCYIFGIKTFKSQDCRGGLLLTQVDTPVIPELKWMTGKQVRDEQRKYACEQKTIKCACCCETFPRTKGRPCKCDRCESTYYCSNECQVNHWKLHKRLCFTANAKKADAKKAAARTPP